MRVFNRRGNRIRPLLDLHCQWTRQESTYPDVIHVAMRDGRIPKYALIANPVRINVGKTGWKTSGWEAVGYQHKKRPLKKMTSFLQRLC